MSNFHMNIKVISRSKGQSAVAAAAYRAGMLGAPLLDNEDGQTHDYRKKKGVISSKIYLPKGAPVELNDRAKLWNAATLAETRKNSTLAREFEISLPYEVTDACRTRLIDRIALEIIDKHGCAVDANQHLSDSRISTDHRNTVDALVSRNYHVHFLLTTRVLNPGGFGKKTRELDSRSKELVMFWRARVAELINQAYEEAELPMRVDHRSLKDQGILRAPQRHQGPAVTEMIREGKSERSTVLSRQMEQRLRDQKIIREAEEYRHMMLEIENDRHELRRLQDQSIDMQFSGFGVVKEPVRIESHIDPVDLLLRPDLISTQGPKLFEAEFGAASRIDFGGAHAGRIVGRA